MIAIKIVEMHTRTVTVEVKDADYLAADEEGSEAVIQKILAVTHKAMTNAELLLHDTQGFDPITDRLIFRRW